MSELVRKLICRVQGHKWVERKPHRMWDINHFDCTRCGAHKRKGVLGASQ